MQHALNPVRGTPYDQGVPLTQSGSARASRAAAPAARSAPPCPHPSRGGSWPGTHALTLRAGKHASAQRGSQSLYESGLRMQLLMQRLAQPRTQHFRYAPDTRGPAPTRAQLQRLFLILPSGLHKQHRTVGPYIAGPYSAWHLGTIKQAKQIEEADR